MTLSDVFYVVIPFTNSLGNALLKLSIEKRKKINKQRFIMMQLMGYSTFVIVMVFSYMFLMTHAASLFVVIFSLNYLATLYVSRWFFKDNYAIRDVIYDALVVVGIVIFYWGCYQ